MIWSTAALFALLLVLTLGLGVTLRATFRWASPVALFCIWIFIFIFGDGIYTLIYQNFGPAEHYRFKVSDASLAYGVSLWAISLLFFMFGYYAIEKRKKSLPAIPKSRLQWGYSPLFLSLFFSLIISIFTILYVLVQGYSLGYNLAETISLRNHWFQDGGGFLLIFIQVFKFGVLVAALAVFRSKDRAKNRILIILILFALILDALTGSRSAIVYGFLLPLAMIYHVVKKPISSKKLVAVGIVLFLLVGVVYRTAVRDQFFERNEGEPINTILWENLGRMPELFWGGAEATSLDGTIDLIERMPEQLEFQHGKTHIAGVTAPIPRPFWPGKPLGGGNSVYTSSFYPEDYGEIRVEFSASFVGELYMNYGAIGVPVGSAVVGGASASLYQWGRRSDLNFLIAVVIISRMFSLWRGDLFNFIGQIVIQLLAIMLFLLIYSLIWLIMNRDGNFSLPIRKADKS
ncbi:MAG: oligosaccharide repeat unit polymerase [Euryarchaeota archaeon]|nr:oligosaccharide repeat unit polymerase [Euryarchaeota archaeon]